MVHRRFNPESSPTYRLADLLMRGRLREFVLEQRQDGRSWRLITHLLWVKTKGRLDVSHETLRSWFLEVTAEELADAGAEVA